MSPLDRRCRALLRAWPWRDRQERGEELVGTMLDVIDPARTWPPLALVIDMLVGGWAAHRRRRPSLLARLHYRGRAASSTSGTSGCSTTC